jgi:hypothetical protein
MIRSTKILPLSLAVLLASLMMTGQSSAEVSCHKLNAKGVGQDQGDGTTTARILGGGLLHGTTVGSFVVTGMSGSVLSFDGAVAFTTNRGTLTVTVTGTLDLATGEFAASGPVTDATGKLAGATGNLALHGIQDLSTGTFVEDVMGEICVNLSPDDV